jgi:thioesterase domain-containing protein
MGGLVAYEMACLLRDAGEEVELVALMDVGVPAPDESPRDATELAVEEGARHLDLDLTELGDYQGEARLEALLALAQRQGKLAGEVDLRWVRWLADGFRISVVATRDYHPRPYDGRVTLIRAEDHHYQSTDPTLGWGAFAADGVDVQWVTGTHHTVVRRPHIDAVADRIRACLAAPRQRTTEVHEVADVG